MAVAIATSCKIYVGQYDVSGDLNKVAIDDGANELDGRVFNNTAGNTVLGLYNPKLNAQGLVTLGAAAVHQSLQTNKGIADVPVTVSPESGAAGDVAVFMQSIQTTLKTGGQVGEILPFTIDAMARGIPSISGRMFVAAGNKTSSTTSAIIQLGAVAATQKVYAALHVFSRSGSSPTLDVTVKSAALVGFGSPTTRLTFTQAIAAGSGWQSLAGAITDQFWRVDWTIGGTGSPTFNFVVSVGIF